MRRYRSFKSLVAKLPESSSTSGRRSGGMTGIHSRTIHSGLFWGPPRPLSRNASTTLSRLTKSRCFCRDGFSLALTAASSARSSRDRSTSWRMPCRILREKIAGQSLNLISRNMLLPLIVSGVFYLPGESGNPCLFYSTFLILNLSCYLGVVAPPVIFFLIYWFIVFFIIVFCFFLAIVKNITG